jgi:signal transduction histidine kinase
MSVATRPEGMPAIPTPVESHTNIVERLSHELRTPLNSVIGFSRVLQGNRTGNQRPSDLAMLEAIRSNGERLLGLVEDLVALSLAPPAAELAMAPAVDLVSITEDTMDRWASVAASRGLKMQLVLQRPEPARVDPMNLSRLLDKLIGNAVKFTEQGGVVVSVRGRSEDNVAASIIIEDTGIGIPADQLDAVFEPFVQADSSKGRQFEGAGLGLPIARALVRSMGCSLTLDSVVGKGTRVRVDFPG